MLWEASAEATLSPLDLFPCIHQMGTDALLSQARGAGRGLDSPSPPAACQDSCPTASDRGCSRAQQNNHECEPAGAGVPGRLSPSPGPARSLAEPWGCGAARERPRTLPLSLHTGSCPFPGSPPSSELQLKIFKKVQPAHEWLYQGKAHGHCPRSRRPPQGQAQPHLNSPAKSRSTPALPLLSPGSSSVPTPLCPPGTTCGGSRVAPDLAADTAVLCSSSCAAASATSGTAGKRWGQGPIWQQRDQAGASAPQPRSPCTDEPVPGSAAAHPRDGLG